jgi:hypothetical protein
VEWPVARQAVDRLGAAMAGVGDGDRAARRWAQCGAMQLTGRPDEPPSVAPARVALAFDEWAAQVAGYTRRLGEQVAVDGAALIGERAAIAGLGRRGTVSCGGGSHLLRSADGWVALSLARADDVELLDAWLEEPLAVAADVPVADCMWERVAGAVAALPAATLVARAALLGLPCAALGERAAEPELFTVQHAATGPVKRLADVMVVDLSSLWAGPLCANLLGLGGARVIKVESSSRPDGARSGPPEFFELLHAGHESASLDLRAKDGRQALADLLRRADVVIEASRPRALAAMGLSFPDAHAGGWRGVWLSVTGHGADGEQAARVAFGDDGAVAGGLVALLADGSPVFCADAVADPATGLLGATAVLAALADGMCGHLGVSLANTAAHLAAGVRTNPGILAPEDLVVSPPRAREVPR